MNSVETAEKCIKENVDHIEWLREREEAFIDLIDKTERQIADLKESLERSRSSLDDIREEKYGLLVTNQALAAFIDNGGGLDMLDEETPKKSGRFHWEED